MFLSSFQFFNGILILQTSYLKTLHGNAPIKQLVFEEKHPIITSLKALVLKIVFKILPLDAKKMFVLSLWTSFDKA